MLLLVFRFDQNTFLELNQVKLDVSKEHLGIVVAECPNFVSVTQNKPVPKEAIK